MPANIRNVPTNIISGFLGVGKTTAILHLFANKPTSEKWAVLVNEFGKIGIDGRVYQANGIAVKEIPGGCMCCAQGLPLQVAINRLLKETRPDRLIIESSGIGHPAGVLDTLKGDGFKDALTLKAGICLVDARHLLEPAYQNNELFNEQIQLADILVANKMDLASAEALQIFSDLAALCLPAKELVITTSNGHLKNSWLCIQHTPRAQNKTFTLAPVTYPHVWHTHSIKYPIHTLFNLAAIKSWLNDVTFLRLKGLIQTTDGCYLINYSAGLMTSEKIINITDNHIEIIDDSINTAELENEIKKFIVLD